MKKIYQFLQMLSLFVGICVGCTAMLFAQCDPIVITDGSSYSYGFEDSTFDCWEQDTVSGSTYWVVNTSNIFNGSQSVSYGGTGMGEATRLITPVFDFSQLSAFPKVSFYHSHSASMMGSSAAIGLKIYFRNSSTEAWTQVASFTAANPSYVLDSVIIPSHSATCQIAFEGSVNTLFNLGGTACLDDVTVEKSADNTNLDSCDPIAITENTPYTEDFSSYAALDSLTAVGVMPDCWDKIYTGSTAGYDPKVYNGNLAPTNGNNALALTAGVRTLFGLITLANTGTTNYAILPEFTNDLTELQMIFTYKMSTDTTGYLDLGYLTDITYGTDFAPIAPVASQTTATSFSINLSNYPQLAGRTVRLALRWTDRNTSATSTCCIDDVMVRVIRQCAEPTQVHVNHIADVSAEVSWTPGDASQNLWEISVNGNVVGTSTTTTYTITGLTATTDYEVNVRAVCTSENSYWAAQPATFTTACAAVVVDDTHPFVEGFEGNDLGCWRTELMQGSDDWQHTWNAHSGNRGVSYSSSIFGDLTNMTDFTAILQIFGNMTNFGNASARLISPIMDLTGLTAAPQLTFYRKQVSMMIPQTLSLYYRTAPGDVWIHLSTFQTAGNWTAESFVLPNPSSTYQICFVGMFDINSMGEIDPTSFMDPNAATDFASNIYLDDIRIGVQIACDEPTNVATSYVSETSFTLTWQGGNQNLNWTIEYGEAGFTLGNGTQITATNPTYTLTGLTAGTTYDVYIRSNCAEQNFSDWATISCTTTDNTPSGVADNQNITINVAPNPTNGIVCCKFSQFQPDWQLQLVDMYGKVLKMNNIESATTYLNLSDVAAGIYFLRVFDGNKPIATTKIIRN